MNYNDQSRQHEYCTVDKCRQIQGSKIHRKQRSFSVDDALLHFISWNMLQPCCTRHTLHLHCKISYMSSPKKWAQNHCVKFRCIFEALAPRRKCRVQMRLQNEKKDDGWNSDSCSDQGPNKVLWKHQGAQMQEVQSRHQEPWCADPTCKACWLAPYYVLLWTGTCSLSYQLTPCKATHCKRSPRNSTFASPSKGAAESRHVELCENEIRPGCPKSKVNTGRARWASLQTKGSDPEHKKDLVDGKKPSPVQSRIGRRIPRCIPQQDMAELRRTMERSERDKPKTEMSSTNMAEPHLESDCNDRNGPISAWSSASKGVPRRCLPNKNCDTSK